MLYWDAHSVCYLGSAVEWPKVLAPKIGDLKGP